MKTSAGRLARWVGRSALGLLCLAWPTWAQTAVTPPGAGTEADPYRISELGHLAWMSETVDSSAGKFYRLENDIDAAATAAWNDAGTDETVLEGFPPIGTQYVPFAGTFNGAGHVISGLNMRRPQAPCMGLFGAVGPSGVVWRLGVECGAVTGVWLLGGLAGENRGTITQCHTSVGVTGGEGCVGGLVGGNSGVISQCYATGAVAVAGESGWAIGGLVGANDGGISQCYATGAVSARAYGFLDHVGGLVGENVGGISQCHATGLVTATAGEGVEAVGGLVGGSDDGTVTGSYWDTDTSGQASSGWGDGRTTVEMKQQTTFAGWDFAGIWAIANSLSYPYLQWAPPPFRLSVSVQGQGAVTLTPAAGLYPAGTLVTVRAVPAAGGLAEFARWTGAVAEPGAAETRALMDCHRSLVAVFRTTRGISSVEELQRIGQDPAYPLDGRYWLTQDIEAVVTAAWNDVGTDETVREGFRPIGSWEAPFTGSLDGTGHTVRGLTINRPEADGVGLFAGVGEGAAIRDLNLRGGSVAGYSGTGAVAGWNLGEIRLCSATCDVTAASHAGGLVGWNEGTVAECYTTGSVTETGMSAYDAFGIGGLVGVNDGTINGCCSTGRVTGTHPRGCNTGGLVGTNYRAISRCYATGAVTGTGEQAARIGGLVGANWGGTDGTIGRCYATGAVTGTGRDSYDIGGLVGGNGEGTISQCYSTGQVTGGDQYPTRIGGLVGYNHNGAVVDSYWDTDTSRQWDSAGGEGRSTGQMQQRWTYVGWDFVGTWSIDEGVSYPRLEWRVATPGFSPPSGAPFTGTLDLTLTCATPGATIRYTLDGSEPTPASPIYSTPLHLTATTTVKAKGFADDRDPSATATATYTRAAAAAPRFTPAAGTAFTAALDVTLSCATPGATIRYTLNGSEPTASSPIYTAPLHLTATATVKARAYTADMDPSTTATATYTKVAEPPAFSPPSGTVFNGSLNVTLTCATAGATIRYTLDGSEPTAGSPTYTGPLNLTATTTVRAKAFKTGLGASLTGTALYVQEVVATPFIGPAGGGVFSDAVTVTIACVTPGATIRYTLNGSDPTPSSPIYSAPFEVTTTTTVKARAFKAGYGPSTTASAAFAWVETPSGAGTADDPYRISHLGHLVWMSETVADSDGQFYELVNDIDASGTAAWNDEGTDPDRREGFPPIGYWVAGEDWHDEGYPVAFAGHFDGAWHVISDLIINRPSAEGVGLFGVLGEDGVVSRLGVEGGHVGGGDRVAGLVGCNYGTVSECHSTATVEGHYSDDESVGGSGSMVGGLVGLNQDGTVTRCYAAGEVRGVEAYTGGLVGENISGTIEQCFATGAVAGMWGVGGLVGRSVGSLIAQCYAMGTVIGDDDVGGLLGSNNGTLRECYAAGSVTVTSYNGYGRVGGLVGRRDDYSPTSLCYWDAQTSGQAQSSGGDALTTAEMKQQASLAGWDFAETWGTVEDTSYPYLRWAPPPFRLSAVARGPGSVTLIPASESYAAGSVVTVCGVPLPDGSSEFVRWLGAVADPEAAETTVLMDGHRSLVAVFRRVRGIGSIDELQRIGNDPGYPLDGHYWLTQDIDATATATWNDPGTDDAILEGFRPIGPWYASFTGHLDGGGHVIRGLSICRPESDLASGLFGHVGYGASITGLGLVGATVMTGSGSSPGILAGTNAGIVSQCYAAGAVAGTSPEFAGGLIGCNEALGSVSQCYAVVIVGNPDRGLGYAAGGLVGENLGDIAQCYATGLVAGDYAGGLVGCNNEGTISQCYADAAVTGGEVSQGLVAEDWGDVTSCYWNAEASGLGESTVGVGLTTAQMKQQASFAGWDFASTWGIVEGASYPYLLWAPPPFQLWVSVRGPGTATAVPAAGPYAPGTVVTVQATPTAGGFAQFARWLGGVADPAAAETTTSIVGHTSLVAVFRVARAIGSIEELQRIGYDPAYPLDGRYWLTQDIDATATADWNDAGTDDDVLEGFLPIGTGAEPFTGSFDGAGHVIYGLTINRPDWSYVGLFGRMGEEASVTGVGLAGGAVTGGSGGGLAGANAGMVAQCYATGPVMGDHRVGGLIGRNCGTVSQCYASGSVTGDSDTGGLIGGNDGGTVTQCYATGSVTGDWATGGLIGDNGGTVSQCYASGPVMGGDYVGGLIGRNSGTVTQCYATGAVDGGTGGWDDWGDEEWESGEVGGLIGYGYGWSTVTSSYWDLDTTGQWESAGGEGLESWQMREQDSFVGWDFGGGWRIAADRNDGYPYLFGVSREMPEFDWPDPELLEHGSALGPDQLNATASVPGTFVYQPAAGTVLTPPGEHTLRAIFVPADGTNWATVTAEVVVEVVDTLPPECLEKSPESGAVGPDEPLGLVFSEPVFPEAGLVVIRRLADGCVFESIAVESKGSLTVDGASVMIGHGRLVVGESYGIEVDATAFVDIMGRPFAGIGAGEWTLTATEWEVCFEAGPHGSLSGQTTQYVGQAGASTPVTAVGDYGFVFDQWSDGSRDNPRTVSDVRADLTLTASFRPADGFMAAAVTDVANRAWWDVTGVYEAWLDTDRLDLSLAHDAAGKITGTGQYTAMAKNGVAGAPVALSVKGSARGTAGALVVKLAMTGTDAAKTTRMSLSVTLTLDAAGRQLTGPVSGRVRTAAGRDPVTGQLTLHLPPDMDGTWALVFGDLVEGARGKVTGTAVLALSNGTSHVCAVKGKERGDGYVLNMTGGAADPAAKGIVIRTTVSPQADGWADLGTCQGRGYGQKGGW